MELISVQSLVLLILAVLFVWLLPGKWKYLGLALLTVFVLLVSNSLLNFFIELAFLVLAYCAALLIGRNWRPRLVVTVTVALLAAGLVFWKYLDFFIHTINLIAGKEVMQAVNIEAPYGISFGFLILIAYVLNVYWKTSRQIGNPLEYANTVAFFPLWVMGPILGPDDFQNRELPGTSLTRLRDGGLRIVWGLFKKLVISSRCAVVVDTIFADPETYGGLYVVVAALLFVLQLYTDFSGAMDMVLGAAEMIGIRLPENFNRPFSATSVSEFWRRWHMTLGNWLRSYVFYPLLKSGLFQSVSRSIRKHWSKKAARRITTYAALFVTWFLIGMWHGGGWNFIFGVGIYYWILIVAGELLQPVFDKVCAVLRINRESWWFRTFGKIRTFLIFAFGSLFFRAGSFTGAVESLQAMGRNFSFGVLFDGSFLEMGLGWVDIVILVLGVALLYLVSRIEGREPALEWYGKRNVVFRWVVFYVLIFAVLILGFYGLGFDATAFVYQTF